MSEESMHDELLGEIVYNKRRDVWLATLAIRRGLSIEIRVLDVGKKTLNVAQELVP